MTRSKSSTTRETRAKGRRFAVVAFITVIVAALGIAEFGLGALHRYVQSSEELDAGMFQSDPEIGWSLTPAWSGRHRHHDFRTRYTINQAGLRYDPSLKDEGDGAPRIWLVGDSFTFGLGVGNRETFAAELNRWVREKVRFVNLGVPGYSTDQEILLVERHLKKERPSSVVLVVYLRDDLIDNESGFPLGLDNAKPFFQLDDGRLVLKNSPVPRRHKSPEMRKRSFNSVVLGFDPEAEKDLVEDLISNSDLLALLGVEGSPPRDIGPELLMRTKSSLALFEALVERLSRILDHHGIRLSLALLPGQAYIERPQGYDAQYQEHMRNAIIELFRGRLQVVDLAKTMRERVQRTGAQPFFANEGHLTPDGHRMVGEILRNGLAF